MWEEAQNKQSWHKKWRQEAQTLSILFHMNDEFKPWTGRSAMRLHGIPALPRIVETLNLKYWKMRIDEPGISEKDFVSGKYIDVS